MDNADVIARFKQLDEELSLMQTLRAVNQARGEITVHNNTILMWSEASGLQTLSFNEAKEAVQRLFDLEKTFPERDIVLVRASSTEAVRLAFRNYF
jgi:putative GTP pyrophosphokinase